MPNAATSTTSTANASTSTTANASNSTVSTAVKAIESLANSASSNSQKTPSIMNIVLTALLSIGLVVFFSLAFTNLSTFLGNKDKWQVIKDQLWKVLPYTLGGSLCLFAVAFVYFKNNAQHIVYFIMILLCISITLAYTALYVSALESYKQT